MQQPTLADVAAGDRVEGVYLLKTCLLRHNAQGAAFLLGEIRDRSRALGFVCWQASAEDHQRLRSARFVRVTGKANRHRDRLQLVAARIAPCEDEPRDPMDYLPESHHDPAALAARLDTVLASVTEPDLHALLTALFAAGAVREAFLAAPAATALHHARPGGLAEHTLAMVDLAQDLAQRYSQVDLDLLRAGALLHDLGKIDELAWQGCFAYTSRGNLLGHIALGIERLEQLIATLPDFPRALHDRLIHMLLSHHGRLEHGALREPAFLEAWLLHAIDDLDATVDAFIAAVEQDDGPDPDWTATNALLQRRVYKGP
ncbi:MAG: 3'-5' exoribonuclease YhaM family protein [Planctomycetota bacterium]